MFHKKGPDIEGNYGDGLLLLSGEFKPYEPHWGTKWHVPLLQ